MNVARPTQLYILDLGLVRYERAWRIQKALVDRVYQRKIPGVLMMLEHPHVYTLGRRGKMSDLLLDEDGLKRLGVDVLRVDRGGEVTYHGPGQLVAYPILDLKSWGGPVKYVRSLEEALVRTLADFGIAGHTLEGLPGVWVGERKVAFIGVRISRGVTCHGISLNVNTDLSFYDHIVPCGIPCLRVTSMERASGGLLRMGDVRRSLTRSLGQVMGFAAVTHADLQELLGEATASLAR